MKKKLHTAAIIVFTLLAGLLVGGIVYLGYELYMQNQAMISVPGPDTSSTVDMSLSDTKVSDEAEKEQNRKEKKTEKADADSSRVTEDNANVKEKAEKKEKKSGKKATPTPKSTPTPTPAPSKPEDVKDISTHDMSTYLSEMPGDDADIVSTSTEFYTYEQMVKDLYFLNQRYPGLFTYETVAVTKDLRQIYAVTLGNPEAPNHVVVQYTMHSREFINSLLAMKQIESYLKNYAAGNTYGERSYPDLFSNFCLHVIPMANPDGIAVAQFGIDSMRTGAARSTIQFCWESDTVLGRTAAPIETYLKTFKANANGVDLNKNFDVGWNDYTDGVPVPSTDCHKGASPASEKETQAILKLVHDHPTVAVISYHSAGNLIYWNYGVEDGNLLEADRNLAINLCNVTGYPTVVSEKYDSHLAGGCSDYFMWREGIPAVTLETGTGTCPLSISEYDSIWNANRDIYPLLAAMYG